MLKIKITKKEECNKIMEKVRELVVNIRTNLSQKSSSQKDEVVVMKAMLNDRDFEVNVYGKDGVEGTYRPAQDARVMISSIITSAAKIPSAEAERLANEHEFNKKEASSMENISKEFVNTYLETGRKLPFGGREKSDISLTQKPVEEYSRLYPKKIGVNEDGSAITEMVPTTIKAHDSVKVSASCPSWVK
jgi:hypothetical protein